MSSLVWVLICTVIASISDGAVSRIRGSIPGDGRYQCDPNRLSCDLFACSASGPVISASRINDGYCDCTINASDEPGTSACADSRFWCGNSGHQGQFIPSSMVDDGICDCCDGSDEENSRCPDRCWEEGRQSRALRRLEARKHVEGSALVTSSGRLDTGGLTELQTRLPQLIRDENLLRIKLDEQEAHEQQSRRAKMCSAYDHQQPVTIANPKAKPPAKGSAAADGCRKVGTVGRRRCKPWVPPQIPNPSYNIVCADPTALNQADGRELNANERHALQMDEALQPVSASLSIIRAAFAQAAASRQSAESRIRFLERGLDSRFVQLDGICLHLTRLQYNYTVCPFSNVTQDSTRIGDWDSWGGEANLTMQFRGGEACWQAGNREADVHLTCATHNELLTVDEPVRCKYRFTVGTPTVCNASYGQALLKQVAEEEAHAAELQDANNLARQKAAEEKGTKEVKAKVAYKAKVCSTYDHLQPPTIANPKATPPRKGSTIADGCRKPGTIGRRRCKAWVPPRIPNPDYNSFCANASTSIGHM